MKPATSISFHDPNVFIPFIYPFIADKVRPVFKMDNLFWPNEISSTRMTTSIRANLYEKLLNMSDLKCKQRFLSQEFWIMERKRSSGFRRIFAVAFDRLF